MWGGDGVVGETGAMTRRQLLRARSEWNGRRCCQSDIGSTEFMNDEGPLPGYMIDSLPAEGTVKDAGDTK